MDFNSVWRKRQACVRCRQLKVRCEYASPTETTCVRCERSHTACITSGGKKKNGTSAAAKGQSSSPEYTAASQDASSRPETINGSSAPDEGHANEEHAVYLQRIIRDAQVKLHAMKISPLRRAIAAKLFTSEEAELYYARFRHCPTLCPLLHLLGFSSSITELDEKWPMLAMAIVSVVALNSASKPPQEIQLYLDEILRADVETPAAFDQHLAVATICQFSLWHKDRGLNTLLHFHALTIALMRKLRATGEHVKERLALSIGAITVLPFMLVNDYGPLSQLSFFFSDVISNVCEAYDMGDGDAAAPLGVNKCDENYSPHVLTSGPLMETIICYQRSLSEISVSTTIGDLKRVVETALTSIQLLENHMALIQIGFAKSQRETDGFSGTPESENLLLTPWRPCYLMAKMKIVRAAANRCIDLRSLDSQDAQVLLQTVIEQAAASGGQLFRSFAHLDSQFPFMPTAVYYYIADALRIMQMMRFVAFAGSIDVDVRSDCLLQVVTVKWEEFVRISTIARQAFVLLFLPLDTANVKIGVLDKKTNSFVGSGSLADFEIYLVNGATNAVQDTRAMTRADLLHAIDGVLQQRDWVNDDGWSERAVAISFPTALKLLFTEAE